MEIPQAHRGLRNFYEKFCPKLNINLSSNVLEHGIQLSDEM